MSLAEKEVPENIPGWLREEWATRLQPVLLDQGMSDEEWHAWFEQTVDRWRARPSIRSERTLVKYVSFTRDWIRQLPLTEMTRWLNPETGTYEHQALRHFCFPTEVYAALNDQSRAKVDWRNERQLLLPDAQALIQRLRELLDHSDWAPLAVALAGLTGRRIGEVVLSGQVQWKSSYSVLFSGRLKRRGVPDKAFEIPTLCEAHLVIGGWERLRMHPQLQTSYPYFFQDIPSNQMNQVLRQVNTALSPSVRKAADYYFRDLIPVQDSDQSDREVQRWGLYTHLFRSVYVTLAIWLLCPPRVHPDAFAAAVLGHTYYSQTGEGEERLNYASGQHYHRYSVSDGRGHPDGRRGILLGHPDYPEVTVIEQFQREAAMERHSTMEQETSAQKKKNTSRSGKRSSKTGFSSLRPRVETRQWFDQVAEEQELTWKGTDATLKVLLETYEAHKRCQQGNVFVPSHLAPQQLGLSDELCRRIATAMQGIGQESFLAFLEQALIRESNTQIGLLESKKKRESEDVSDLPLSKIRGSRRPEAARERIRRAIGTIIDYNRQCSDPNGFWYLNVNLLREYTGASPTFITPLLKANADLITRHHEHFKITRSHNQTPAHKAMPISQDTALVIPEDPAQIKSLGEIVLPGQEAEVGESAVEEATEA